MNCVRSTKYFTLYGVDMTMMRYVFRNPKDFNLHMKSEYYYFLLISTPSEHLGLYDIYDVRIVEFR